MSAVVPRCVAITSQPRGVSDTTTPDHLTPQPPALARIARRRSAAAEKGSLSFSTQSQHKIGSLGRTRVSIG